MHTKGRGSAAASNSISKFLCPLGQNAYGKAHGIRVIASPLPRTCGVPLGVFVLPLLTLTPDLRAATEGRLPSLLRLAGGALDFPAVVVDKDH